MSRIIKIEIYLLLCHILLCPSLVLASEDISIIVTSNLEGRFSLPEKDQETIDPFLLLAQDMLAERANKKIDLYFDLGNAFYPGTLSRYSFGSIVMDYFNLFSCDAALISSKDLRIGVDNLQFLQTAKQTRLLSANITRDKKPVFTPYTVFKKGDESIACMGLSSKRIRFDIAEKNLYSIQLENESGIVPGILAEIEKNKINHIILLSGLNLRETISLLKENNRIEMAICGGDNTGEIFSGKARRIDLADGRPVLLLPDAAGYYIINLTADADIRIKSIERKSLMPVQTNNKNYREFRNRLSLWKQKFRAEEDSGILNTDGREYIINDNKFSHLMRDEFNSEVSVIEKNTINPTGFNGEIKRSDIISATNQDYNIFVYDLKGEDLKKLSAADDTIVVSGFSADRIQGYPVEDQRRYRVSSGQSSFEKVGQILHKHIEFKNSWITITDLLMSDLKGKKRIFRDDFSYIDNRFRVMLDFSLSNYIEHAGVSSGENIDTPLGQPSESYQEWGLENKIDLTIYNRYHQIVVTPYMFFVSQEDQYLENLLRGTLLYTLNIHDMFKPYGKTQFETVVREVEGMRPVVLRETTGANIVAKFLSGKLGAGFEKKIYEPAEAAAYGLEAIINLKIPFLEYFTYIFNLDSFYSIQKLNTVNNGYVRCEMENALSLAVSALISVSFKYKYYYFYSQNLHEKYINSQWVTSLDFKTDFKMF